jgi:putative membrane protein
MFYLFLKWLHLLAIISWMAGILYLFRLFVNHAEKGQSEESVHRLLTSMEEKLYRFITVPAMSVAWMAAIGMLVLQPALFAGRWMHYKLLFVLLLTAFTVYGGQLMRRFKNRHSRLPSGKTLRILNEVPTLLMMIIVAMVVFRP